ncbi:hypothetical protein CXL00_11565 [Stutzerimonas stutzeri]|uniref:Uncharacterized protein n=1 Tax=Stutzerimonas stutzeri TaxID=316 RepID=A0A2N8SS83_STUST|nr:hypothetical protein CXL00_11565 [Stutzerimonas stutzeri]
MLKYLIDAKAERASTGVSRTAGMNGSETGQAGADRASTRLTGHFVVVRKGLAFQNRSGLSRGV